MICQGGRILFSYLIQILFGDVKEEELGLISKRENSLLVEDVVGIFFADTGRN